MSNLNYDVCSQTCTLEAPPQLFLHLSFEKYCSYIFLDLTSGSSRTMCLCTVLELSLLVLIDPVPRHQESRKLDYSWRLLEPK